MRKTVAKGTAARKSTTNRAKKVGAGRTAKKGRPVKPDRSKVAVGTTRKAAFPSEAKRKALRPKAPADTVAATPHAEPAPERPDPARPRAVLIAQAGLDKKAEDVLVLDVRGLTSYADYFVLMTADSDRQAGAIADSVDEKMKANGSTRVGAEGYETGRWILIDYGDVVAHVMSRDARGFYDLEGLWADAPRFEVAG
ncbi:MAG TPA: ribosome silencing factor [Anaeromyxobacteraceae bacterium]|nr:ribosome silencing factor [Anaeromyxobacteraceae bacterium]